MREPKTHDYTARGWGRDLSWRVGENTTLKANGRGVGIREGDDLLLPNGDQSARYQVREIRSMTNPLDQWFATPAFAPREETA